jgi:hypothetical protein
MSLDFKVKSTHKVYPVMTIVKQGELLKAKVSSNLDNLNNWGCGGSRSAITFFTDKSRKNLLETFARLDKDKIKNGAGFLTLTYGQVYPDLQGCKRDIDVFVKRLNRKLDLKLSYVWKVELQKRGAPHVHIVLFGWQKIEKDKKKTWALTFKEFEHIWAQVIGVKYWNYKSKKYAPLPIPPHTQIRFIYSLKQLMYYVSKYMSKLDDNALNRVDGRSPSAGSGFAGFINMANLTGMIDKNNYQGLSRYEVIEKALFDSYFLRKTIQNYCCYSSEFKKTYFENIKLEKSKISTGRFWGIINRDNLPLAIKKTVCVKLSDEVQKIINKISLISRYVKPDEIQGFTLFSQSSEHYFNLFKEISKFDFQGRKVLSLYMEFEKWVNDEFYEKYKFKQDVYNNSCLVKV